MPARSKPTQLHPEARAELQASVDFYRAVGGDRLASRFKRQVAEGFETIGAKPGVGSLIPNLAGVRQFRMKQFPFSLIFVDRKDFTWVVAVAHGRRKPGYGKGEFHKSVPN